MRLRWWIGTIPVLLAAPAFASLGGGGGGSSPTPEPGEPTRTASPTEATKVQNESRKQAEHAYGEAFEQIVKAKADAEAGKGKNAAKEYKRALESAREAARLDAKYHEAWNLVGFASRKLGNYDDALKAYATCLDIKPDYAPAREYLGEAYLEQAKLLKVKIDAWDAAHPQPEAAKPAAGSGQ